MGKKKGGKKGKKSGKSGKKKGDAQSLEEKVNEVSKEFFVITIRTLEDRLQRYEEKCRELQESSDKIAENYGKLAVEQQQFVKNVAGTVTEKEDEVADCKDRTLGLQQAKDAEKELYEAKLGSLRGEFQQTKDELTSKNMQLASQLASLEEFKVQREELEMQYGDKEDLHNRRGAQHKSHLANLESKSLKDRDRLKKEMMHKVNIVASDFRKVSNKMMADTTKRTIRENVSINAQIQKMSDKSAELDEDNLSLRDLEQKSIQQIKLLQFKEKDLARKNQSHKAITAMLNAKLAALDEKINLHQERESIVNETKSEMAELQSRQVLVRDETARLETESKKMQEEILESIMERDEERKRQRILETILSESVYMLKDDLIKLDVLPGTVSTSDPPLFNQLVETLRLADNPEKAADELAKRPKIRPLSTALSHVADFSYGSNYQQGDAGFVPRADHRVPSQLERSQAKMQSGVKSANTKEHHRITVLMNSKAVQTDNSRELLADQLLNHVEYRNEEVTANLF